MPSIGRQGTGSSKPALTTFSRGLPPLLSHERPRDWYNQVGDMLVYVNDVLTPHGIEAIGKDDFAAFRQMIRLARVADLK